MNDQRGSNRPAGHGAGESVADAIDRAFHYRGDVRVRTEDGAAVTGYLFNRNTHAREPFVQVLEKETGNAVSIPYRRITRVDFIGPDAASASARRFAAFQRREEGPAKTDQRAPLG